MQLRINLDLNLRSWTTSVLYSTINNNSTINSFWNQDSLLMTPQWHCALPSGDGNGSSSRSREMSEKVASSPPSRLLFSRAVTAQEETRSSVSTSSSTHTSLPVKFLPTARTSESYLQTQHYISQKKNYSAPFMEKTCNNTFTTTFRHVSLKVK